MRFEFVQVNGLPAAVVLQGDAPVLCLTIEPAESVDRVGRIWIVLNPDKLHALADSCGFGAPYDGELRSPRRISVAKPPEG